MQNSDKKIAYGELIVLLALMTSLGALTIDLQLPAMPMILASFGLYDVNQQQWMITAYMFGFATAQIFYGPISDSVGRKPILIFGLTVYVLASIACLMADTYWLFLLARSLQGVGAAAARIMVNAITRDFFHGNEMARVTSLVMLIFIMVPVFAPALGSLLLFLGPWRLILSVFVGFGLLVMLWSLLRLPESLSEADKKTLRLSQVKAAFVQVISEPLSMSFAVISGVIFAGFMAYLNAAEQIYSLLYDAKDQFPLLFGGVALFFGLAAFINAKIVMHFGAMKVTFITTLIMFIANLISLLLVFGFDGLPPLWLFVMMMSVINVCIGLVYGNMMAIAMLPLGKVAGMGASVIGTVSAILAAGIGIFISQQLHQTITPIMLGFFFTSMLAFALVYYFRHHTHNE
ncbi:MAG: Bcr/CflA family drug resistance efflux transporter [marine bacterium B5-7]|nr:MAG: Bcr/CflA family drug resistance efflux transporter [marine bacterium B5-7]